MNVQVQLRLPSLDGDALDELLGDELPRIGKLVSEGYREGLVNTDAGRGWWKLNVEEA